MLSRRTHGSRWQGWIVFIAAALGVSWMLFGRRQIPPTTASNVAAASNESSAAHAGRYRFLALGDSYTIGQSVAVADRWPVQLAQRLRKRGIDVGDPQIIARTGWTTGNLLSAMDAARLSPDYQLVMLLIGVNNQFQGRSEDEYRRQFIELLHRSIALAGGSAKRVVVLSIPDWSVTPFGSGFDTKRASREIDEFNAINRMETLRAGVAYVDITPESRQASTQSNLIAGDGLHPSGVQYGQWAELAADAAAALASPPNTATAPAATVATQPLR